MSTFPDRPILEYNQRPRPRWRRRIGWSIVIAICLAAAFIAHRWGADISRQVTYLRLQHRCMTHSLPPDTVVLETDPAAAAKLLADKEHYWPAKRTDPTNSAPAVRPPALRIFPDIRTLLIGRIGSDLNGAIFLHARRTKGGIERLVAIQIDCSPTETGGFIDSALTLYVPAKWTFNDYIQSEGQTDLSSFIDRYDAKTRVTVYAGQIDPDDESHFWFEYVINGVRMHVDYWLNDPAALQPEAGPYLVRMNHLVEPLN